MSSLTQQIKSQASIVQVWAALGGGRLYHRRGQAFWRKGAGFNVAVDPERGSWYDFRDGVGGDIFSLVETVRQCDFSAALDWLAGFLGVSVSAKPAHRDGADTDWASDLRWAGYWRIAAEVLAEQALETLPAAHLERLGLTAMLASIRLGDAALVREYRDWRRRAPELTAAMVHAGRRHDARVQRKLALWLAEVSG
jgi:hypothetical protein